MEVASFSRPLIANETPLNRRLFHSQNPETGPEFSWRVHQLCLIQLSLLLAIRSSLAAEKLLEVRRIPRDLKVQRNSAGSLTRHILHAMFTVALPG